MEYLKEQTKIYIKETGRMAREKAPEMRYGLMAPFSKENILTIRKMDLENLNGQMVRNIRENSKITSYAAKACTLGRMEDSFQAIGKTTKCMVLGIIHGHVVNHTKVNTKTTKNMDLEFSLSPTTEFTKVFIKMASNTVLVSIQIKRGKYNMGYGIKVNCLK